MRSSIIETYRHDGNGYEPFLIRDGWQVAQLNYMPQQDLFGITKMDRHFHTDEAFIAIKGVAVLIGAKEWENGFAFEYALLKRGAVYNIPAGAWHNIAMGRDAALIIVEKDNTHTGDFECRQLTDAQKKELNAHIGALLT
ncbi:MAG TPA: hypothetical protein VGM31_04950 [Puia sp.]|jgi:mannose-6-phosphate isomerase-like protein (cupin superfamily)